MSEWISGCCINLFKSYTDQELLNRLYFTKIEHNLIITQVNPELGFLNYHLVALDF